MRSLRRNDGVRGWRDAIVETGPQAKEQGQHLESGEGNELDSPLELPEKKIQPCQHIDFSLVSSSFGLVTSISIRQ